MKALMKSDTEAFSINNVSYILVICYSLVCVAKSKRAS